MRLLNDRYVTKTADDRACVAIMLRAAELMKKMSCEADVTFVATCQEEIGCYGAKVAGFKLDPDFGVGFFEDDDYCRRVEAAGLGVACAEDVFVHHHLSASFDKLKAEARQQLFLRNRAIYEAKWGTWQPHQYRGEAPASDAG